MWSLEAGTLISCFFCFTNSSWRPGERISILEAEIRGGQKITGEVGNSNGKAIFNVFTERDAEEKPTETAPVLSSVGRGAPEGLGHKSSRE